MTLFQSPHRPRRQLLGLSVGIHAPAAKLSTAPLAAASCRVTTSTRGFVALATVLMLLFLPLVAVLVLRAPMDPLGVCY